MVAIAVTQVPASPEVIKDKETYLGEGSLLRLVKVITFLTHEGGLMVGEVFKKDAKIGGIKIEHVDPKFIRLFGSVVTKKLPPADMPVWEVASRNAKHRAISIAICGDSPGPSEDPKTALARFYQTIEGVAEYSREREIMDLRVGLPNILHARSAIEENSDDPLHAILWYVNPTYGGGSISIYVRPRGWYAACQIKSLVFGGVVPAPAETPAVEPAIA